MKLIVEYDPILGDCEPDALIEGYINRLIYTYHHETDADQVCHVVISSEIIIAGIRAAIKQKRLNSEEVVFRFKGQDIHPYSSGRLSNWPDGFCNHWDNYLTVLLTYSGQ